MPLSLREAQPGDIPACIRVFTAAARTAFPWIPPEARGADHFLESLGEEELWVAEADGTIAGLVSIHLADAFIHHLYVHPRHHRQGIGRALLALALRRCGGHAELKCLEANRAACRFYAHLGWRAVDWGWSGAGAWIRFRY
ncbi:MAG TPA: GNAT family N-acetyltransferase [Dongiaceae bacterium]|nr:GNAT family N-acetyltransferase [Dongiaceae bacterium]